MTQQQIKNALEQVRIAQNAILTIASNAELGVENDCKDALEKVENIYSKLIDL